MLPSILLYFLVTGCAVLAFLHGTRQLQYAALALLLLLPVWLLDRLYHVKKDGSSPEGDRLEERRRELALLEEHFRRELDTDPLTGLFKRTYLVTRAEEALAKERPFTIFYIDLNKFKVINDIQGHNIGDLVLQTIGTRLQALNSEEIFFARFGGDEFAGLLYDTSTTRISEMSGLISATIRQKIQHNEFDYEVSASIGVSRCPEDGNRVDQLIKLSDIAMYHAKKNELGQSFIISREFADTFRRRNLIEKLLRELKPEKDLSLVFQPQFDINSRELLGMEALTRWYHPEAGEIPPAEFIPIAEEIGIVKDITKWVFVTGLQQIKEWNERYSNNHIIHLNVSQNCIHNKVFFGNLTWMIETFQVNPEWIGIELTEYSAMHSPQYMTSLLHSINELGVKIAIDDFGTGASSLTYIKRFGINYIKIDKSLIDEIEIDRNNFTIIKAIIQMAHCMGMKTIAEGVETEGQLLRLGRLDCDLIQGFILGHPETKENFEKLYFQPRSDSGLSIISTDRESADPNFLCKV